MNNGLDGSLVDFILRVVNSNLDEARDGHDGHLSHRSDRTDGRLRISKVGAISSYLCIGMCVQTLSWSRSLGPMVNSAQHVYEIRPRKDRRGVDLISDVLPFGRLWYIEANAISNAIGYAKFFSRSHDAVIRVYGEAGNVIETHDHTGDFKEW